MSLADTCGVAGLKRCYSRFHSYQRNECIPFTLLFAFFRHTVQLFSYCQKSLFVRPCITEHRVLPCPSVVQSYSVSSFVPWCYNDVTRIELRERICRTATGDAVRAPVFVRTWVFGVVGPRAIVIIFWFPCSYNL